jgi:hypothetical protein
MKVIIYSISEAIAQASYTADGGSVPASWVAGGTLSVVYPNPRAQATDVREDGVYDTDNDQRMPAHLVWPGRKTPETESEFLQRLMLGGPAVGALVPHHSVVPAAAQNPRIVDSTEVPVDDHLRMAWKDNGTNVAIDMSGKAQAVHRDHLRHLRKPKLGALDVEYMKALEAGDTVKCAEIAAKKQALRDCTTYSAIDAATTPEELKAAIPPIFQEPL